MGWGEVLGIELVEAEVVQTGGKRPSCRLGKTRGGGVGGVGDGGTAWRGGAGEGGIVLIVVVVIVDA